MQIKDFDKNVEKYARYLCEVNGKDPDSYYEEFNRNAAACVAHTGDYEGWQDSVFPKIYAWMEYETEAQQAVSYFFNLNNFDDRKLEELYFMCYVETLERKEKEKSDATK